MMGTRVSYRDEQQHLEGYLAAPDSRDLPGVLVVPSWLNVTRVSLQAGGPIGRRGLRCVCRRFVRSWRSTSPATTTYGGSRAFSQ